MTISKRQINKFNEVYSQMLSGTIAEKLALRPQAVAEWADKIHLTIGDKISLLREIGPQPTCELGSKVLCAVVNDVPLNDIVF